MKPVVIVSDDQEITEQLRVSDIANNHNMAIVSIDEANHLPLKQLQETFGAIVAPGVSPELSQIMGKGIIDRMIDESIPKSDWKHDAERKTAAELKRARKNKKRLTLS
jgi:hypothetical protein